MKKKKLVIASIAAILAGGAITAGAAYAQWGGAGEETRQQIQEAENNKDYQSWVEAQNSVKKITDYIDSEEDFAKFTEMKDLMKQGEFVKAEAIREELGLPERGHEKYTAEEREAIYDAEEAGDYETWKTLHDSDDPVLEAVQNQEDFDKLVEMHQARKDGDLGTAREIGQELDLPMHGGQGGPGHGRGFER